MKALKQPISIFAILVIAMAISGCGKTKRTSNTVTSGGPVVVAPTEPAPIDIPPVDPVDPVDPTPTNPALSYEFTLKGNQVAAIPPITTDNVLKVKFRVNAEQGNHIHKATELKVTISMGGTEVEPKYTTSNYTYGQVGETSNVIDLSSYATPGQPVNIQIKLPKNDFYCTYWGGYYWNTSAPYSPLYGLAQAVNPQYNQYPGCRKEVHAVHNWGGVLIVQTSNTQAI